MDGALFKRRGCRRQRPLGVQRDLDPSGEAGVECLVGIDGVAHRLSLREDVGRIDRPTANQVEQLGDVAAMLAVDALDREVLHDRPADREAPGSSVASGDTRPTMLTVPALQTASAALQHVGGRVSGPPVFTVRLLLGSVAPHVGIELLALGILRTRRSLVRGYGLDADGIDGAIGSGPSRQALDRLDRVLVGEVDHLRPLRLRHREARRLAIDRQDPARAPAAWPTRSRTARPVHIRRRRRYRRR